MARRQQQQQQHHFMSPEDWAALRQAAHGVENPDGVYRGQGLRITPGPHGPRVRLPSERMTGFTDVHNDDNEFTVLMDVRHFRKEQLSVRVVGDPEERILVHGTHTDRPDDPEDDSEVSREFWRQYVVPRKMSLPPHRYLSPADWAALRRTFHPRESVPLAETYHGQGIVIATESDGQPVVRLPPEELTGVSDVRNDDQVFRVRLDVHHFRLEELSITIINDERVAIRGTHVERPDDPDDESTIKREFVRQYVLPKNCDMNSITAQFSNNGILVIRINKLPVQLTAERNVPIKLVDASRNDPSPEASEN